MTDKRYDHRDSEYALQAALTYAVHRGALGETMLVHGKRAGAHPDIVAISIAGGLTLLELKRSIVNEADALEVLCQIASYALFYRKESMGRLATWYCHARVESLCGLSFRGDASTRIEEHRGNLYHLIEQFDKKQVQHYREAAATPGSAFACFADDFERRFGRRLGQGVDSSPSVSTVVVVAETWTEAAQQVIFRNLTSGFDRARLESGRRSKYVETVLQDPAAFGALASVGVELRRTAPSTWLERLPNPG